MPLHKELPLELVHQVIDEFGEAFRRCGRYTYDHGVAYRVLLACTLVSKRWAARSRMHIFRKVTIQGGDIQPAAAPPLPILPYIKDLEILAYDSQSTETVPIADLLKAFITAPIESLTITEATLVDGRGCIQECITARSTLQTVEFHQCTISAYDIADILSGRTTSGVLASVTAIMCNSRPRLYGTFSSMMHLYMRSSTAWSSSVPTGLSVVSIRGSSLIPLITPRSVFSSYQYSFVHAKLIYQSLDGDNPGQGVAPLSEVSNTEDKT